MIINSCASAFRKTVLRFYTGLIDHCHRRIRIGYSSQWVRKRYGRGTGWCRLVLLSCFLRIRKDCAIRSISTALQAAVPFDVTHKMDDGLCALSPSKWIAVWIWKASEWRVTQCQSNDEQRGTLHSFPVESQNLSNKAGWKTVWSNAYSSNTAVIEYVCYEGANCNVWTVHYSDIWNHINRWLSGQKINIHKPDLHYWPIL